MVKLLPKMCHQIKYVGWHFALIGEHRVLVDGNSKPNIDTIQIINYRTFGSGIRDSIINALGKYDA